MEGLTVAETIQQNPEIMAMVQDASIACRHIHQKWFQHKNERTVTRVIQRLRLKNATAPTPDSVPSSQSGSASSRAREHTPKRQPDETREYNADDGSVAITKRNSRATTPDEFMLECGLDPKTWEYITFKTGRWEMGSVPRAVGGTVEGWSRESSKVVVTELWTCSGRFRPRTSVRAEDRVAILLEQAREHAPVYFPVVRTHGKRDLALELSFPDAHFGKLAWGRETGFRNYDLGIAVQRYRDSAAHMLSVIDRNRIEEIVFVIGHDLLNCDNREGTTEKNTPQDNDSRYHKIFESAVETQIAVIDNCRVIAPVKVIVIPGNHDTLSAWHVGRELKWFYQNDNAVTVDTEPCSFKAWKFGNVLIGFTHGNAGKRKDYPLDLAVQFPEQWGDSLYREIHTGDKHHIRTEEMKGVKVRILPSLSEPDEWHSTSRYIGNVPSAESFIWHRQKGLIEQHTYNIGGEASTD